MLDIEIIQLLSELKNKKIELKVEGKQLKVLAPKGAMTKALQENIKGHKEEIIAFLQTNIESEDLPTLDHDEKGRYKPFSLTDVQQAYWVGRRNDYDLGNVATHIYYEFEDVDLQPHLIEEAWKKLIQRHDMLRAIIHTDGTQQVLEKVPEYHIEVTDLSDETKEKIHAHIEEVRQKLSHQVLPSNHWPLFDLTLTKLPENKVRLHVSIDLLIADGLSCQILLKELASLYQNPDKELEPIELTFKDYMDYYEKLRETNSYKKALDYWRNRVQDFPSAPQLKLKTEPENVKHPHFIRKSASLNKEQWHSIKKIAKKHNITPSMILLTAYANVLKIWSKYGRFAINVTLFNRPPLHKEINHIIGDFTSLNLLEIILEKRESFINQVESIQKRLWQDLDHREVSGIQVMRELAKRQGTSKGIAMPVVFTSELLTADDSMFNVNYDEVEEDQWNIEVSGIGKQVYGVSQTPQVWLDHQVGERAGVLTYNWDILEDVFDKSMIDAMFETYKNLLKTLASNEELWYTENFMVDYATPHQLVEHMVEEKEATQATLQSFIDISNEEDGEKIAIATSNQQITYGELNKMTDKIGCWLKDKGAKPNTLIAIVMEKGWEQVVAAVGILKSGAAYLPISAELPEERIQLLLEDGEVDLIVSLSTLPVMNKISQQYKTLCVDKIEELAKTSNSINKNISNDPSDLAYVIYTSGSTGRPKGVMITHEAVCNTLMDMNQRFNMEEKDRVFAISEMNFDLSVFDVFSTLQAKGTLVIPDNNLKKEPLHWIQLANKEKVTVWNSVPALVEMMVDYAEGTQTTLPETLRLILMSGDWIPISLVNRIRNMNPSIQLISLGGATEASIWSIFHPIQEGDLALPSIPYGRPLSNQSMYVLDDTYNIRPTGVPGKLYIGGIGLAKGYWKDDEKTKDSFVIHPVTHERLYRTGDWGYYREDGTIIFLGREDNQVKIGGHRIELGEIEAHIGRYDNVKTAVAIVKGDNSNNKGCVVFYDTVDGEALNGEALVSYLEKVLPSYMIPKSCHHLEHIPLTANGKVDRKALQVHATTSNTVAYVAPESKLEKALVELLEKELEREKIGMKDNYFELGGDSIIAIRLLLNIQKTFKVDITAKQIFESPIIADLAKEIAALCEGEDFKEEVKQEVKEGIKEKVHEEVQEEVVKDPSKEKVAEEPMEESIVMGQTPLPILRHDEENQYEPYPLTGLQQAYYVGRSDAVAFGNVACHTYEEIDVRDFKAERFTKAWQKLINRHDVLRTVIHTDGTQQLLKDLPDYEIDHLDLSNKPQDEKEKILLAIREEMSHEVMDITTWPLFELKSTQIDDNVTRLHIGIDAMIADAWSVGILCTEVCKLYEDEEFELEPMEITYRDYVVGEIALKETEVFKQSLEYWQDIIRNLEPAPDLPLIKDFSSVGQPKFRRRRKELDPAMWQQLKKNAAKHGLTPSGIMMAAFAEVLAYWSKSKKFTLNVPQFNRLPMHRQVDDLIGEFASFYLMPIDHSKSNRFIDRAKTIQSDLWQHMNHSVVSGVQMLREYSNMYGNGETLSMPIVYTSTIGLIDQDTSPFDGFGDVVYSISQTPQVWLDCQIGEKGNTVIFNWDSIDEIFPEGMLDDMFQGYCNLLNALAYEENVWEQAHSDLLPKWQSDLFDRVNDTYVETSPRLLHHAFAEQAEANPQNMALITSGKSMTYHELYCYADQLGEWLINKGAKANNMVTIAMEKGWEQIVAVMGILNAGAAFVPIDMEQPEERIKYILSNSKTHIVLTQSHLLDRLDWAEDMHICSVDDMVIDGNKKPAMHAIQHVDDIAYLIYTSGSTGEPKGVMVTHRNVDNMVYHTNTHLGITAEDKAIAVTALHHDLSIYDVFGMLSAGATMVIPDHHTRLEAQHLYQLMMDEQVTFWNSVPAIMDMFIQYLEEQNKVLGESFRQVILGGDWIPITLPDRIKALGQHVHVLGIGGPTETTVWNIWSPIEKVEKEWNSIPYGKPISNNKFYILDEHLSKRPVWSIGEMYCAGNQVAKGYWQDPKKTAEKFIIHPKTGERIYRTGDLGRYRPDGNIEFSGRADFQVKINGLRIELGEIESTITDVPEVRQTVACVFGENQAKQLVAFVVKQGENHGEGEQDQGDLESVNIITDPIERLEFKQRKLGIRKDDKVSCISLSNQEDNEAFRHLYCDRRSYRNFVKEPMSLQQFGDLMACLQHIKFDNLPFPKYRYASAGGLYPVQVYIYVKPDRIHGLEGGTYYYKPDTHQLMMLSQEDVDGHIFPTGNKEIFDESAFAVFLVANLDAIEPMYGPLTEKFCYLEAGIMSQLLEESAVKNDMGFCQIGKIDFDAISPLFKMDQKYLYLHCLIGGSVDTTRDKYAALEEDWSGYKISQSDNQEEDLLERIKTTVSAKLPAYMVPNQIILLDKLPVTANGKIDRQALSQYAVEDKGGQCQYVPPSTDVEKALVQLISKALGQEGIGLNHNLFQIGADSLVVIQLSSQIRQVFQVNLSLKQLFMASTIGALANEIVELGGEMVGIDTQVDISEELPPLGRDLDNRYEPFPLTDVQQAYWVGRNSFIELGNISTHVYLEIEQHNMDLGRFEEAWQKMIDRHEMLRAIIRNDGQQQILKEVPFYKIERIPLDTISEEERNEQLNNIRERMSHQILQADQWPLFEIKASILDDETLRLHVSIDLLISDVWSARIVTKELMALYSGMGELEPITLSFRDYVIAESQLKDTALFKSSWDYWLERIKTLPAAPDLPLIKNPASLTKPHFERRIASIDKPYWDKLKAKANQLGVTHSGLLAAAYAEILTLWSKSPHFTLNLTLFNRLPFHEQVNEIVGDFTSLILLEVNNTPNDSFEDRVIRVQQQILDDIDHRYVSGVKVIRELAKQHQGGPKATMPVVFTSTLNLGATEYPSGSLDSGDDVYGISQTPQIWLDHVVSEQNGNLVMNWDAVEELFPVGMLDTMFDAYLNLLYRLAEDEKAWTLPMSELVPLPELQQTIRLTAQREESFNANTLNGLFNKKAVEQPSHIAITTSNKILTYDEVYGLSNKLGRLIKEKNSEKLVGIIMDKGWEQVVGAMAILQAGYAYLPISPDTPIERMDYLCNNANVEVVLTQSWLKEKLDALDVVKIIHVDDLDSYSHYADDAISLQTTDDELAYVIYTSGSTGQPKGVMINHKGAVNTILDINERFQVTNKDRVIGVSELNFDLSVYDVFGTLAAGGTLVIPDATRTKDPSCWLELINDEQVTLWNSVPALMEMLVEYTLGSHKTISDSLRLTLLSGDWIPVDLPSRLKSLAKNVDVISLGGATEASIWSIYYPIGEVEESWKSIPYGKPLTNQKVYILDEHLAPRMDWVPGPIYIGGDGVAMGYLNDEALTKSKFILHPETRERLYYTGDLGRYLPDGNIEFLGREDYQVKVQGYRIELGEIESVMKAYKGIKNAVVDVCDSDNGKGLVGYYVAEDSDKADSQEEITLLNSVKSGFKVEDEPIVDPVERLKFKLSYKSLRKELINNPLGLPLSDKASAAMKNNITRRSYRKYHKEPIALEQLGSLLSGLAYYKREDLAMPKLQYGSAGSLYPVQTYIYVKENRIKGLEEGVYYYNPMEHGLVEVSRCHIADEFYPSGNREIYTDAAFSIFFLGKLEAIKPMYGQWSNAFIKLEAGSMCQLLEMNAMADSIGLCQIGSIDFEAIEGHFKLDSDHVFAHHLVGGLIKEEDQTLDSLIEETKDIQNVVQLIEEVAVSSEAPVEDRLNILPLGNHENEEEKITDPIARAKFKLEHKGLRDGMEGKLIPLPVMDKKVMELRAVKRRSYRSFNQDLIPLNNLSDMLSSLKCEHMKELPFAKRRYASAGNLYPIQVYVYVKENRVEDLDGGIYYYNPYEHTLMPVAQGAHIPEDVFPVGNKEIFAQAGFAIFMLAQTKAIAPLYPQDAYDFCVLETGEMAQLLESTSVDYQIGLCQIGSFEFNQIQDLFKLDEGHVYMHCILGGAISEEDMTMNALVQTTADFTQSISEENMDAIINSDYLNNAFSEDAYRDASVEMLNEKLREFLLKKLPKHMVPGIFVKMDQVPLTSNGKVDRKNLPKPGDEAIRANVKKKEFVLPNTEREKQIAEIWKEIVGLSEIGLYDNFFELGGNSMHLVKAYNRMKEELSDDLPITVMFEYPTIHALSDYMDNQDKTKDSFQSDTRASARRERRSKRREKGEKHSE